MFLDKKKAVQVSQNKKGDLISALRAVAEGVKGGVDSRGQWL